MRCGRGWRIYRLFPELALSEVSHGAHPTTTPLSLCGVTVNLQLPFRTPHPPKQPVLTGMSVSRDYHMAGKHGIGQFDRNIKCCLVSYKNGIDSTCAHDSFTYQSIYLHLNSKILAIIGCGSKTEDIITDERYHCTHFERHTK